MYKPKISVIMAEYNTEPKTLKSAIRSILKQSFKEFELIIVDDKSSTDVEKIISYFNDPRIRSIKNTKNLGSAYSRDRAIKSATADYVAIMDADDISKKNRLFILYSFIKKNPQYDVVGSLAEEFGDDGVCGVIGWPGENTIRDLIRGKMVVHASSIINKKAYLMTRYDSYYRRAQDYVLFCQMSIRGSRMYTIDQVLYRYRVNRSDLKKRGIRKRRYEIEARIKLYPKMQATPYEYLFVIKCIMAGLVPVWLTRLYRKKFVLRKA